MTSLPGTWIRSFRCASCNRQETGELRAEHWKILPANSHPAASFLDRVDDPAPGTRIKTARTTIDAMKILERSGAMLGFANDRPRHPHLTRQWRLDDLAHKDEPATVPDQQFHPVCAFGAEYPGRSGEGFAAQFMLHQRRQTRRSLAKIDGPCRHPIVRRSGWRNQARAGPSFRLRLACPQ